ncbi:MAG: FtsQ-type POTRA domain-containing protein [Ruminococcaceae bacterium]|nr:FtsQ-type POTRA domain-containing protein [Oscillospiraceae bacterium]
MDNSTNRRPVHRHRPENKPRQEETVYTEAKPVNITRFLIRIATVVAIVMAIVFGMSIFFKVDKIEVAGTQKYSVAQIQEASGVLNGTNLLTLNKGQIASRILAKLPYIQKVLSIGIRLPDTVIIQVEETEVSYAVQSEDGSWFLVSCQGKILEQVDGAVAYSNTRILGVKLEDPQIGKTAVASEMVAMPDVEAPSAPITVYNSERLSAALQIAKEMETNEVLGELATIDVSDMSNITAWYGKKFEIRLGDGADIPKKVFSVVQAISQLGQYQAGVLDASFTTWPDEVYYKSFD